MSDNFERYICENLEENAQKNALDFAAFLRASEMQLERCGGYWEDKLYWAVNYHDQSVCYILIDDKEKPCRWTIWSDDSGSQWFADVPLDDRMKNIVWDNVDVCEKTDRCFDGCRRSSKTIFGKAIDNVCGTAIKFEDPNAETVECMKKIFEIRKNCLLK